MKKIFIISMLLGLVLYTPAKAADFYYTFHLYYDNGQLNADRDFKFKYDVVPGSFFPESFTTQFPYHGEVVNILGNVSSRFDFDPKLGNPNFSKGKISVNAPYFSDAQKIIFYDAQNQPILNISVLESSFCNDDGICNADRGEDFNNCSNDCKNSLVTPLPAETTETKSTGSSGIVFGILYLAGGIILAGLVWWLFRRRRQSNNISFAQGLPQTDTQTLPTPSAPPNSGNNV